MGERESRLSTAGRTVAATDLRPTLLLIAGTLCDRRLFAPLARRLGPLAHIRTLDLRGLRPREQPQSWVWRNLTALPASGAAVLGFSLGGFAALALAAAAPERVTRLALVSSNVEGATRNTRVRQRQLAHQLRSGGLSRLVGSVLPLHFATAQSAARHRLLLLRMARRTPLGALHAQMAWAGRRPPRHDLLAQFDRPLLVAAGMRDRLCPPAWQHRAAAVRQVGPALRAGAGHFLPLEAPGWLAGQVRRWLALPTPLNDSPSGDPA